MNPNTQVNFQKKTEALSRQIKELQERKDSLIKELFKLQQENEKLVNELAAAKEALKAQQNHISELLSKKKEKQEKPDQKNE